MSYFFEQRVTYLNETVTLTVTVSGSGSLAGWTFTGALYGPDGTEVEDAVTAELLDADERTVTVTVTDLDTAGDYRVAVTRSDDDSGLLVVRGVIEVTDPSKP